MLSTLGLREAITMLIIQQRLPSGLSLNSSKALSPPVRGHCREYAVIGLE